MYAEILGQPEIVFLSVGKDRQIISSNVARFTPVIHRNFVFEYSAIYLFFYLVIFSNNLLYQVASATASFSYN